MPAKNRPDGEARKRILEIIEAEPGIHRGELARRMGMAPATIAHHVSKLQALGLVRAAKVGRLHRLVAAGHPPPGRMDVLLSPEARAVMDVLLAGGVHAPRDLRNRAGLGEKALRRALQSLEQAGLIRSDGAYHPRYWMPGSLKEGDPGPQARGGSEGGGSARWPE